VKKASSLVIAMTIGAAVCSSALAQQQVTIIPTRGQGPEQVQKDQIECYEYAKMQSQYDPAVAGAQGTPAQQTQGGAVKGAVGGAAAGYTIAAVTDHKRSAAAGYGAAAGAIIGGVRQHRQNQQAAQEQAYHQQKQQAFDYAQRSCMQTRGYAYQ